MEHTKSQAAFEEARQYIPGGVNSPVRSFRSESGACPASPAARAAKSMTSTATNTSTTLCPMVRCSWAMYPTA